MKKPSAQFVNSMLILVGGAILIFEISGEERNVYSLIVGLVLLMYGLFKATNFWVETKDDHLEEKEDDTNTKDL